MPRKVIIVADPGIDTAFAVALALNDPEPRRRRRCCPPPATCPPSRQPPTSTRSSTWSTRQSGPSSPRRCRQNTSADGLALHGPGGTGRRRVPSARRGTRSTRPTRFSANSPTSTPAQVTVVNLGPLTTLATALDRDPELPAVLDQTVIIGGCWREAGNAGPVAEFHIHLDPDAAKRVLARGTLHPLLIPLDVTRKLIFSPSDLLDCRTPSRGRASSFARSCRSASARVRTSTGSRAST